MRKYTPEDAWRAYEQLPQEIKKVIFSVDTSETIEKICVRNNIKREKSSLLAEQIGYVLLGLFPPEEFKEWLYEEFGKEKGKLISHDIFRFIFFPIKNELEEIYKTEVISLPKAKISPPPKRDIYREPIE